MRADEVLVEALGKDFVAVHAREGCGARSTSPRIRTKGTGLDHDAAVQDARNSLYFEFV